MATTATDLFEFLRLNRHPQVERHEIFLNLFSALRSEIRRVASILYQSEERESITTADELRILVLGWLTKPVPFDESIGTGLARLGTPSDVEAKWGREVRNCFERALEHASALTGCANPLRAKVRELLNLEQDCASRFRIYCDRRSRSYFEDLLPPRTTGLEPDQLFIHSVAEYRDSGPFDALIKVGPLRPMGVGAVPDAVRTVPKFKRLLQVVWRGCNDDQTFGLDPAIMDPLDAAGLGTGRSAEMGGIGWITEIKAQMSDDERDSLDIALEAGDDFEFFDLCRNRGDVARATLIKLNGGISIPVPPLARLWGISHETKRAGRFLAGETLIAGDNLILPEVTSPIGSAVSAELGQYSKRWKLALKQERAASEPRLLQRLRDAGIAHTQLAQCVNRWSENATTVIHAPKRYRDFRILMKVLGLESEPTFSNSRSSWVNLAWEEVRQSRGEAIQSGQEDQRKIDEELQRVLDGLFNNSAGSPIPLGDRCPIPTGYSITGSLQVFKIEAIEDGFQVPREHLHIVRTTTETEQWRD